MYLSVQHHATAARATATRSRAYVTKIEPDFQRAGAGHSKYIRRDPAISTTASTTTVGSHPKSRFLINAATSIYRDVPCETRS